MSSTKKIFASFGKKSSNKKKAPLSSSSSAPNTRYYRADENDPIRMMQERMLHKALHNGNVGLVQTAMPPMTSMRSTSKERMDPPHTRVVPPRGTLCDDKLPYLDWRLSLIMLEQSRIEEKERQEYNHQQQQISIHTRQSQIRSIATANRVPLHSNVNQNVSRRWSSITSASTSDSTSISASGSEVSSRKHTDSVNRHDALQHDQNQNFVPQGWQRFSIDTDTDADREAKAVLRRAIARDDVLSDVPHLSKMKHESAPAKFRESEEVEGVSDEEDSTSSGRSSTSLDEFHDAEVGGEETWARARHLTTSISTDSYFSRILGLGGNGIIQRGVADDSRTAMMQNPDFYYGV